MFVSVKLDNTLLTCDQGNFNQGTAQSQNLTLVTVVRHTCSTTVPPAPFVPCIMAQLRSFITDHTHTLPKYVNPMPRAMNLQ